MIKFLRTNVHATRNSESGRSMIEMLGVLAIMGVITIAAIGMVAVAMRNANRNAAQDQATKIVQEVRSLLGGFDDYSGIDNTIIFAAIGIPARHSLGGTFSLAPNPSNLRQFVLTISGLNHSDCVFFSTRAWTDSVGFQMSDGRQSGAVASPSACDAPGGRNSVNITFN
ncbi:MAG: hypothetical protein FWC83_01525 [Alphaproteobacteria bacterium]|nr:hypothetical protein [Alphaproteobacteria bacterium]